MTVVVAVQTTDSLVLASDSATTQMLPTVDGGLRTSSIWNSADKIVNLRKTWPIGAMTFGRATFAGLSISNHCKELRQRLAGDVEPPDIPRLSKDTYTIEEVCQSVRKFFGPLYAAEPGGVLGFLVGGFSAGSGSPELWQILISEDDDSIEQMLPAGETGVVHQGVTDAVTRLLDGAGQGLGAALKELGIPEDQAEVGAAAARSLLRVRWTWAGMPVGETIDLARFLVSTTINFVRFEPGDATVGGPIEVAALTKHEGFKWVQRKHYYPSELNQMRT